MFFLSIVFVVPQLICELSVLICLKFILFYIQYTFYGSVLFIFVYGRYTICINVMFVK